MFKLFRDCWTFLNEVVELEADIFFFFLLMIIGGRSIIKFCKIVLFYSDDSL